MSSTARDWFERFARRISLFKFEPLAFFGESGGSVYGWGAGRACEQQCSKQGINRIRFYLSVKIFNGMDEVSDGLFCFSLGRLKYIRLFYLQIAHQCGKCGQALLGFSTNGLSVSQA